MDSFNTALIPAATPARKVLNWLEDNVASIPDCHCCRKRKIAATLNTTTTVRSKDLQDRLELLNKRRLPLKKRDEELAEKNRQLRQRAQAAINTPMSPVMSNSNTIIRSRILQDRLGRIQEKMILMKKRDEDIQERNRQLKEKLQGVLDISMSSFAGNVCHEESPAKRPRLDTTFQRNSVARQRVHRVPRGQNSRFQSQTSKTFTSVTSAHELKTYLKNGLQYSLVYARG